MISTVILTHNEAANLPRCLASLRWCDDVLVLDSGSSDDSVAIARAAGARVATRAFDSFAAQRNHAMEHGALRHPWVLHVDADEVVTPALAEELRAIAAGGDSRFPVYRVPSRLIFMGRWLRHAGMYPAYQVRFGRAAELRFVDHGHGQRETHPIEQVGTLREALDHHNFSKGVNDWLTRHLRYARAEAAQALAERSAPLRPAELVHADATVRRRAAKRLAQRLPCRAALRFAYVYFVRGGFLDGRAGFHYARLLGTYQYLIDLNTRELAQATAPPS